jgi:hypothetical protein
MVHHGNCALPSIMMIYLGCAVSRMAGAPALRTSSDFDDASSGDESDLDETSTVLEYAALQAGAGYQEVPKIRMSGAKRLGALPIEGFDRLSWCL